MQVLINNREIKNGDILKLEETQSLPNIKYNYQPNKYYVLLIVDPDAPSRENPIYKYWLHYMMINITNKYKGDIINIFQPPNPPKNSGYHRYFILLLESNNKIVLNKSYNRSNFNLDEFKKKFNLICKKECLRYFRTANLE